MFEGVKRISIVGGPGTGKTTLARNLGKELDLPICHIDAINHFENWERRNPEERNEMILAEMEKPKWIIDGTYKDTLEKRIDKSDVVIFLNYSRFARLRGIFSRYLKNKGKEKLDIPGCKEKMDWRFIKFTLNWNKLKSRLIEEVLNKYNGSNKQIYIFKNRKQLNKWYEKELGKKIDLNLNYK